MGPYTRPFNSRCTLTTAGRRLAALFAVGVVATVFTACEPVDDPAEDLPAADGGPDAAPLPPDAGRIGEPPPEPVEGLSLLWGAESLLLTAEGTFDGPAGMGNPGSRIELDVFDADGEPIETLTGEPGLYPVPGPWSRRMWWPMAVRPATAIYRLWADDVLLREAEIEHIADVPVAQDGCDPDGFTRRCARDSTCFGGSGRIRSPGYGWPPRPDADGPMGRCGPVSLTAWQVDDVVLVDVRTGDAEAGGLPAIGAQGMQGFTSEALRGTYRSEGWRRFGYLRGGLPAQFDLYIGPHVAAFDVPVQVVPERPRDAACDPERLIDRCAEGTACGPEATCRAITAPIVDQLTAVINADGVIGLSFSGQDAQADVNQIHLDLMGADGRLIQRRGFRFEYPSRPNRFGQLAFEGHLEQEAGSIRGFFSVSDTGLDGIPVRVRMALEDAEGLVGQTVEADLGRSAPVPVGAGDVCDPFEVLDTCPAETFCDRPDGSDGPMTCHRPAAACPLDLPVLDGMYEGENGSVPDRTTASCTWSRGNIGNEQGHSFTAARAGLHRFVAEAMESSNAVNTLFVRRYCDRPRVGDSELACRNVVENEDADQPMALEVEMEAGETVYVFVEANWFGGGAYTLAVEPPL